MRHGDSPNPRARHSQFDRIVRRRHFLLAIAACVFSCDRDERIVSGGHALTKPALLCHDAAAIPGSCRKPEDVEALLQREDLEILAWYMSRSSSSVVEELIRKHLQHNKSVLLKAREVRNAR